VRNVLPRHSHKDDPLPQKEGLGAGEFASAIHSMAVTQSLRLLDEMQARAFTPGGRGISSFRHRAK
jgi:hypothetical protein